MWADAFAKATNEKALEMSPSRSNHIKLSRTDALHLWHGVMLDGVTGADPDLSPRQMAILTTVYLSEGPHTVRSLARNLGVTKAVVTRALDTLAGHDYLARAQDPRDGRSVIILGTPKGQNYLFKLGDTIAQTLRIVQIKTVRASKRASGVRVQEVEAIG